MSKRDATGMMPSSTCRCRHEMTARRCGTECWCCSVSSQTRRRWISGRRLHKANGIACWLALLEYGSLRQPALYSLQLSSQATWQRSQVTLGTSYSYITRLFSGVTSGSCRPPYTCASRRRAKPRSQTNLGYWSGQAMKDTIWEVLATDSDRSYPSSGK